MEQKRMRVMVESWYQSTSLTARSTVGSRTQADFQNSSKDHNSITWRRNSQEIGMQYWVLRDWGHVITVAI